MKFKFFVRNVIYLIFLFVCSMLNYDVHKRLCCINTFILQIGWRWSFSFFFNIKNGTSTNKEDQIFCCRWKWLHPHPPPPNPPLCSYNDQSALYLDLWRQIKGLVAGCHSFCLFFIFLYIHTFNHNSFIRLHSLKPLSISSSHVRSVGKTSLWCRAENRTRACLTASRRATNWATPQIKWLLWEYPSV